MTRIALLAAAAFAAACTSILPAPERLQVYQLPPSRIQPSGQPAGELSLRVATPDAGELTGGTRILVLRGGSQVSVYEGARWIDPAGLLVRNRLADAFRVDGRFRAVTTDSANLPADVRLGGELGTFQVEYAGGGPRVKIRYDAVLALRGQRSDAVARRFEAEEPVQGAKVPEVVEAFGRALDRLAAEVVAWTVRQAAEAGKTPAARS